MERKAERIAALVAAADRLGRKFEGADLVRYPKMAQIARDWLLDMPLRPREEGFLNEMWGLVNTGEFLTLGQAKGVLNVIVARERYAARRAQPQTGYTNAAKFAGSEAPARDGTFGWDLSQVANGRYRVEFGDGSSIAVRLDKMDTDNGSEWARRQPEGTRNVYLLTQGADGWTGSGWVTPGGIPQGRARTGRVCEALEILARADSTMAFGVAFARLGNQCYICGRNLDTAESIDAGYGPVCADKYGLPWGNKRTPQAVVEAREAVQASPAPEAPQAAQAAPQAAPTVEEVQAPIPAPAAPQRPAGEYYDPKAVAAGRKQMSREAVRDAKSAMAEGRLDETQARRYVEIFGDLDDWDRSADLATPDDWEGPALPEYTERDDEAFGEMTHEDQFAF